ncbi:hypothetical protein AAG570_001638 [Ranatra chinensis]|uniref:C2 domain-containing protein n=1 Tax=Ranatra chinensis TaxID=642074 RepID=A0ABD0YRQ1_9HEMI
MYKEAEANAKAVGDTAKSRRLGRGLKTLSDLLKKAQRGVTIDESEIPLPVAKGAAKAPVASVAPQGLISPLRPAPPVPPRIQISEDSEDKQEDAEKSRTLALLAARRDEYKKAAVGAKRRGDTQKALEHVKLLKQFEAVMAGVEAGQPFDLSTMPPPPSELTEASTPGPSVPPRRRDSEKQAASDPSTTPAPEESALQQEPLSVLSALEQRLAKFREQEEAGKRDGNSSKARRMGRIVKQYEDAIKLHKAGRPIPVDELPTPPGFPPIPVESSEPVPSAAAPKAVPNAGVTSPTRPQVSGAPAGSSATNQAAMGGSSRVDRQLAALLVRQKELKEAALKAKRDGDIAKAKEFLKQAKGLDPLIQAANSGVRVDMSSIPIQPDIKESIDSEFDIVMLSDCLTGTDLEIYDQLVANLQTQFKLCMETRNHFKAIGDVANANRFEQLAVHTKNDLDMVRTSKNRNDPIPRFHYEKRKFSIVRCNVDLGDNDLELSILQGINYNVPNPKEVDTYVRFEFPLSNDETKKDKTAVIYNTNNPTYEAVFPITVQRNSRSFQRLFKRHSVKMEVWSRG